MRGYTISILTLFSGVNGLIHQLKGYALIDFNYTQINLIILFQFLLGVILFSLQKTFFEYFHFVYLASVPIRVFALLTLIYIAQQNKIPGFNQWIFLVLITYCLIHFIELGFLVRNLNKR